MSLRRLSIVLIMFAVSTGATSILAQSADESCSYNRQQVVGQTVVCDPVAKPDPVATWWANSALGKFYRNCCRDAKRNNCWPEPFVKADRMAVRLAFSRMVNNGLRRENTLGNHHFIGDTGKLNRSGQLMIRQILLEGLPQRRVLYVYRAERAGETAKRIDAVQQYTAMIVRDGAMPPIYATNIPAPGRSAQSVDIIDRKYTDSMPDPRLPTQQQSDEEQ